MNLDRLREYLQQNNFDGILLRKRNNFSWLTGGQHNDIAQNETEGVADLVVTADQVFLVTSKQEERRIIEEEAREFGFTYKVISDEWYNGVEHLIASIGGGKTMATDTVFADWALVTADLAQLRSHLSVKEMIAYSTLCRQAAEAVEATCREIEPGQREHDMAARLAEKVIRAGYRIQVLLVATDERIYRYRHPIPTNKPLYQHAMLVLCAESGGLVANVTRMVHFGSLPEELEDNKEKLAHIEATMYAHTMPDATAGDVIQAAVGAYAEAGFPGDWKKLHQGGLTGYQSREYFATPETKDIIQTNQAFAWNPALPGVKMEDTALLTEDGLTFLTHTGSWVYQEVTCNGMRYKRPDILVRYD